MFITHFGILKAFFINFKICSPDFRWTGIQTFAHNESNESNLCSQEDFDPEFCVENESRGYVVIY